MNKIVNLLKNSLLLLSIGAVVSILIITLILINAVDPQFGFKVNFNLLFIERFNDLCLSLSTGYMTGYIIYIITIEIPHYKKKKIFDKFISDIISELYNSTVKIYCVFSQHHSLNIEANQRFKNFLEGDENYNKMKVYFVDSPLEMVVVTVSEILKDQRKIFLDSIVVYNEYMSFTQHELIRNIRKDMNIENMISCNDLLKLFIHTEKEKEYSTELMECFSEYVSIIIELKETIK